MPTEVLDVTNRFMRNPVRILVKKEELTLEGIRQFYIEVEHEVSDVSTASCFHLLKKAPFWYYSNLGGCRAEVEQIAPLGEA